VLQAATQFCITPILRSDGSRLWLKGQVTDLPAGLRNAVHLNNQGTVVGHFDANPPRQDGTNVAVVTAGGSPVILPVPAGPAGLNAINRQIPMGPGYLALGDDGTIVGSAQVAGIPDPQNPPAGCRVAEWCCFNHVLKWSPPYSSYTVLDGPHAVGGAQTTGGFVQLCGPQTGKQFRMLNLYDGRAWPMTASTRVDAALGWDFTPIVSQCHAWGINPQSMNRNGNWIGQPLP